MERVTLTSMRSEVRLDTGRVRLWYGEGTRLCGWEERLVPIDGQFGYDGRTSLQYMVTRMWSSGWLIPCLLHFEGTYAGTFSRRKRQPLNSLIDAGNAANLATNKGMLRCTSCTKMNGRPGVWNFQNVYYGDSIWSQGNTQTSSCSPTSCLFLGYYTKFPALSAGKSSVRLSVVKP